MLHAELCNQLSTVKLCGFIAARSHQMEILCLAHYLKNAALNPLNGQNDATKNHLNLASLSQRSNNRNAE